MVSIPKISLGTKERKAHFNMTHDVNTTSDFGFCQPTLIHELIKDTKVSLKPRVVVRPSALPVPPFARMELKQYTCFVPHREVFPAWEYLQANKSVSSGLLSYIPITADYITNEQYFGCLVNLASSFDGYSLDTSYKTTPFLGTLFVNMKGHTEGNPINYTVGGQTFNIYVKRGVYGVFDFNNNPFYATDGLEQAKLNTIWADFSYKYVNRFIANHEFDPTNYDVDVEVTFKPDFFVNWNYIASLVDVKLSDYFWNLAGVEAVQFVDRKVGDLVYSQNRTLQLVSASVTDYSTADYTKTYTMTAPTADGGVQICLQSGALALKYTRMGNHLHKIMSACRFGFRYKQEVSLIPLLAYYKGWFDKFNPQRNIQWKDTSCFKLIHGFYDKPDTMFDILGGRASSLTNRSLAEFMQFIKDLANCYYTLAVDPITVATDSPVLDNTFPTDGRYMQYTPYNDSSTTYFAQDTDWNYAYDDEGRSSGGLGVKVLLRLLPLINKNSVLGANVDAYLKAHGISNGLPDTPRIAEDSLMINIDDIFSNINNEQTVMGEYGGKGLGSAKFDGGKFTASEFGTLVQYTYVVPLGGYAQATKTFPRKRYDFYQSEFDSLGMEAMPRGEVLGTSSVNGFSAPTTFGFRPRFFGLKYTTNLLSGDFSRNSTKSQFLPYTLDRIFAEDTLRVKTLSNGDTQFDVRPATSLYPDESLRYIGKELDYGNYDRIFYDNSGVSDNFIIDMVNEFHMWSPMLPIDKSFDTYDEELDDSAMNVERA